MYYAKNYKMSSGTGYGKTRITAFDKALLEAGVGNYNLSRLSSILPVEAEPKEEIDLKIGSLLPIAYAEMIAKDGEKAQAAVAIGRPVDKNNVCVIMEYETTDDNENAVEIVIDMVKEGFEARGWELESIVWDGAECTAKDGEYAVAFACVAEW